MGFRVPGIGLRGLGRNCTKQHHYLRSGATWRMLRLVLGPTLCSPFLSEACLGVGIHDE